MSYQSEFKGPYAMPKNTLVPRVKFYQNIWRILLSVKLALIKWRYVSLLIKIYIYKTKIKIKN
jgi:hypothetical protein